MRTTSGNVHNFIAFVVGPKGTNMALTQPAIQYTTWSTFTASLAVDGTLSTASCTGGITNMRQWWAVDLGQPQYIDVVQVSGDIDNAWRKYHQHVQFLMKI